MKLASAIIALESWLQEELAAQGRLARLLERQEAAIRNGDDPALELASSELEAELASQPRRAQKRGLILSDLASRWGLPARSMKLSEISSHAAHDGVPTDRLEKLRGEVRGVAVYDDFAHHPGAIATTLAGLRRRVGDKRILAVLEPRSNTMRMGVHAARLPQALAAADEVLIYGAGELGFDPAEVAAALGGRGRVFASLDEIVEHVRRTAAAGDHILVMSNGDFGGIHQRILEALAQQ